jgi:hypothetical protein
MSEVDGSKGNVETLYRLDSVTPVAPPDGSDGTWYRYVIVQGSNIITGQRSGTLPELNPVLEDMVARLNERAGKQRAKAQK